MFSRELRAFLSLRYRRSGVLHLSLRLEKSAKWYAPVVSISDLQDRKSVQTLSVVCTLFYPLKQAVHPA